MFLNLKIENFLTPLILDDTDMTDSEEATYSSSSFIADLGGAAGLIFGLNIMGLG